MTKLFRFKERGQMIVIAAVLLPVLVGMAGMAIDIGSYSSERRTLQNAADSIALAAARELPDQTAAQAAGQSWATKNNIDLNQVTITITGGNTAPAVSADIAKSHNFSFVKIVGINSKPVSARAKAIKASYGGGAGIVPWSITQGTLDWAGQQGPGATVIMKYDAEGGENGNFGAIRIDGPGSNVYGDSVKYGSDQVACAEGTANCTAGACPGTYPATCSENSPTCDGPECHPETGNVIGKTREGIEFRINYTSTSCDSLVEAFGTPDQVTGKYQLNPNCNPWTDGPGSCPTETSICSRRVMMIPVVDEFGNGQSPATITRFALVFLMPLANGKCTGNSCEIQGIFINADVNARSLAGTYDAGAPVHFVRLTE